MSSERYSISAVYDVLYRKGVSSAYQTFIQHHFDSDTTTGGDRDNPIRLVTCQTLELVLTGVLGDPCLTLNDFERDKESRVKKRKRKIFNETINPIKPHPDIRSG